MKGGLTGKEQHFGIDSIKVTLLKSVEIDFVC